MKLFIVSYSSSLSRVGWVWDGGILNTYRSPFLFFTLSFLSEALVAALSSSPRKKNALYSLTPARLSKFQSRSLTRSGGRSFQTFGQSRITTRAPRETHGRSTSAALQSAPSLAPARKGSPPTNAERRRSGQATSVPLASRSFDFLLLRPFGLNGINQVPTIRIR